MGEIMKKMQSHFWCHWDNLKILVHIRRKRQDEVILINLDPCLTFTPVLFYTKYPWDSERNKKRGRFPSPQCTTQSSLKAKEERGSSNGRKRLEEAEGAPFPAE